MKLREFPEHVQKMAADSDFKYAEEYEVGGISFWVNDLEGVNK